MPFLLVLTAFGAYTAHNAFADILLMLGATAVGVAAIRWDWPRAPLLLALVLGDIAERYLFLSYSLYEWRWLGRPLVIAFAVVTRCRTGVAAVAADVIGPMPAVDSSRRRARHDRVPDRWRYGCCIRQRLAVPHRGVSAGNGGRSAGSWQLMKLVGLDAGRLRRRPVECRSR